MIIGSASSGLADENNEKEPKEASQALVLRLPTAIPTIGLKYLLQISRAKPLQLPFGLAGRCEQIQIVLDALSGLEAHLFASFLQNFFDDVVHALTTINAVQH